MIYKTDHEQQACNCSIYFNKVCVGWCDGIIQYCTLYCTETLLYLYWLNTQDLRGGKKMSLFTLSHIEYFFLFVYIVMKSRFIFVSEWTFSWLSRLGFVEVTATDSGVNFFFSTNQSIIDFSSKSSLPAPLKKNHGVISLPPPSIFSHLCTHSAAGVWLDEEPDAFLPSIWSLKQDGCSVVVQCSQRLASLFCSSPSVSGAWMSSLVIIEELERWEWNWGWDWRGGFLYFSNPSVEWR